MEEANSRKIQGIPLRNVLVQFLMVITQNTSNCAAPARTANRTTPTKSFPSGNTEIYSAQTYQHSQFGWQPSPFGPIYQGENYTFSVGFGFFPALFGFYMNVKILLVICTECVRIGAAQTLQIQRLQESIRMTTPSTQGSSL
jgi:hypothetical protein